MSSLSSIVSGLSGQLQDPEFVRGRRRTDPLRSDLTANIKIARIWEQCLEFFGHMTSDVCGNQLAVLRAQIASLKQSPENKGIVSTMESALNILETHVSTVAQYAQMGRASGLLRQKTTFSIPQLIEETLNSLAEDKRARITYQFSSEPLIPSRVVGDEKALRMIFSHLFDGHLCLFSTCHFNVGQIDNELLIVISGEGQTVTKEQWMHIFNIHPTPEGLPLNVSYPLFNPLGIGPTAAMAALKELGAQIQYIPGHHRLEISLAFDSEVCSPQELTLDDYKELLSSVPRRILLVDDTPMALKLLERLFKLKNWQVETAVNGKIAEEMIKHEGPFDLVVMDFDMPVQDGPTTINNIRLWEEKNPHRIPPLIIGHTASAVEKDSRVASQIDGYMAKTGKNTPLDWYKQVQALFEAETASPDTVVRARLWRSTSD